MTVGVCEFLAGEHDTKLFCRTDGSRMGTSEMKRWYFISGVENYQVEGKSLIIMFLKEIALIQESS